MKVYISPAAETAPHGLRRVLEALHKYLPVHDVEVVETEAEADVVHVHAMAFVDTDKPTLYTSHGLYWEDHDWPTQLRQANQAMIDYMTRADGITAVSHWVNKAIRRGILRRPVTIHHGVDSDTFTPGDNRGYVLWNKARADAVSDPEELMRIARKMPDTPFVTTLGQQQRNVQVLGPVSYETMQDVISKAGVYLATARETFGIGTLEALACGVPVVGWDHGGQREIVTHGEDGYLAPYGDYQALTEYVRLALEDEEMRERARETAVTLWSWYNPIKKYVQEYKRVWERKMVQNGRPDVSVIVTAHNLDQYLPACLDSVAGQEGVTWECIIVDDSSTDNTEEIGRRYEEADGRFLYLPTPRNLKLSGARNYGMKAAQGRYVIPLDADDMLGEKALAKLAGALDDDPFIHIAYGHLDVINDSGEERRRNDWPFGDFNWFGQMAHLNQLPYCSMMRREVIEESGGYRVRDWRAEDAAFWCRVTSLGFRAKKVTEDTTLVYRIRGDSKSVQEREAGFSDGDWTSWYPWRIAGTAEEGIQAMRKGIGPPEALVPFGAQGKAPRGCWPVWSHHAPLVTVVIPVGPGHEHYVIDAVDSVQGQTFPFWEVVVVDNTMAPHLSQSYLPPWVRLVRNDELGIALSRNAGLAAVNTPLVLFLDADDILVPNALRDLVQRYVESDGRYTYGDWIAVTDKVERKSSKEYDRQHWATEGLHPITALIPTEWARAVGGFDPDLPGWEDWDFYIKMCIEGYCGQRVAEPTIVYRMRGGRRREQSLEDGKKTLPILRERYADYFEGRKKMAGCCDGNGTTILQAKSRLGLLSKRRAPVRSNQVSGLVRLESTATHTGKRTIRRIGGKELSRSYTLSGSPLHKYVNAPKEDADMLIEAGFFKPVQRADQVVDAGQMAPRPSVAENFTPPNRQSEQPAPVEEEEEPEEEEAPEPEPAVSEKTPEEIAELNIDELRAEVVGFNVFQLKEVLRAEVENKDRITAVRYLKELIKDTEKWE